MKNKIHKLLSLVLALAMVFTTCICAITTSAETISGVVMVQGTIDNNEGEIMPSVSTRIYTQDLLEIADYASVTIASGYKAYYHFYDMYGNWVWHSEGWIYGGVTATDLYGMSYGATHFRIVIGTNNNAELTPADFPDSALVLSEATQLEDLVTIKPAMAQGTIDNTAGEVMPGVSTRIYTQNYLLISDYAKISVASGYKAYLHFYDKNGNWVSHSGKWLYGDITAAQLNIITQYATYFSVVIGTYYNDDIFLKDYTGEALTLALASGLKEPTVSDVPLVPESPIAPELPADPNITLPTMVQGSIDSKTGDAISTSANCIYTDELISVEDYEMVKIAKGYKAWLHSYDKDGKWLGGFGWQEAKNADLDILVSELKSNNANTAFFRVVISKLDESNITPESFSKNGLKLVRDKEKYSDFTFENVFKIGSANYGGPWQEGAIFDGKLFMLNHDELGGVFDMQTGKMIGEFICDRDDFLSVHSNTICFGTEYYDENDKYPLMYICVYNNYEGQANQYEGHCGVYRIIEDGADFKGELVQVIRIGFTEDMNMWKSLPNRGDVCPFGNFIVDTDKNDLYAYVMRDGTQTTRYYKFDLPKVDDGEYNSLFGCKTVTLNVEDIKDQFDTEYSVYLQGADYVDGMILSSSGLGHDRAGGAILRLVDLESKKVIKVFDAVSAGVLNEPEVIAVDPDTKKVYYGSTDGQLRYLTCIDEYINKTEHSYSESYTFDDENHWFECATCDEKKDVEPHKYTNACDTKCNVCNATRTIKHSYKAATCTAPKTCKVCGKTSGEALGHDYETKYTKATTSKNGKSYKQCERCDKKTSETTIYKIKSVKLSTTKYTYNGNTKKPSVIVKDSKGKTIPSKYYTIERPKSSKKVGKYTVKVKFKTKYSGTVKVTYTINPAKTSVKKLTAGKKSLKVAINKKSTQVTGYEIQYSTSKTFKSKYTKSKKVTSYKTTSVTLKSLKAKKTYYVRVRTYKTVDGKKYYSGWSSYKYKKTK